MACLQHVDVQKHLVVQNDGGDFLEHGAPQVRGLTVHENGNVNVRADGICAPGFRPIEEDRDSARPQTRADSPRQFLDSLFVAFDKPHAAPLHTRASE